MAAEHYENRAGCTQLTSKETDVEFLLPQEFHVHDAGSASWLVRRVVEAREYANRVKDWAAREQRRAVQEEEFLLFRYGKQLEYWAAEEIERQRGRRRSIGLPGGTVGFRKVGPLLVIEDESAVLEWARRQLPDAIVVTEKLSKSAINDHLKETGELPPLGARASMSPTIDFLSNEPPPAMPLSKRSLPCVCHATS